MSSPDQLPDIPFMPEDNTLPEAGNDPDDPNVPSREQSPATPPIAAPERDMEAQISDDDLSELSDVDEAQFAEFDPANIAIEDRPLAIDEENINAIGRHKRKRVEGEESGTKKRKEGRRERKKKRVEQDEDDNFSGGEELAGKRRRKRATGEDGDRPAPVRRVREETPDEELDEDTRRRRDLDRRMDAALKNPNRSRRRKLQGDDVANNADEAAKDLYNRMQSAAQADNDARMRTPPEPALRKLKILPEVVAFLNRNGPEWENAIADNDVLVGVRFFLEPLGDGSLPAYNIQRELFAILSRYPMNKDTLISSGLGKIAIFYTKSKRVQPEIVRQADRLLAEWTRPILKRSDNYRNRALETRVYDPDASRVRSKTSRVAPAETAEERRKRELALPRFQNRAQMDTTQRSYSIVPMSQAPAGQAMGKAGDDAFKRIKARHTADQRAKSGLKPKKKGNAI